MGEAWDAGFGRAARQRYIDRQIRDGRSWAEALERLAEVLGLRDNSKKE